MTKYKIKEELWRRMVLDHTGPHWDEPISASLLTYGILGLFNFLTNGILHSKAVLQYYLSNQRFLCLLESLETDIHPVQRCMLKTFTGSTDCHIKHIFTCVCVCVCVCTHMWGCVHKREKKYVWNITGIFFLSYTHTNM